MRVNQLHQCPNSKISAEKNGQYQLLGMLDAHVKARHSSQQILKLGDIFAVKMGIHAWTRITWMPMEARLCPLHIRKARAGSGVS